MTTTRNSNRRRPRPPVEALAPTAEPAAPADLEALFSRAAATADRLAEEINALVDALPDPDLLGVRFVPLRAIGWKAFARHFGKDCKVNESRFYSLDGADVLAAPSGRQDAKLGMLAEGLAVGHFRDQYVCAEADAERLDSFGRLAEVLDLLAEYLFLS